MGTLCKQEQSDLGQGIIAELCKTLVRLRLHHISCLGLFPVFTLQSWQALVFLSSVFTAVKIQTFVSYVSVRQEEHSPRNVDTENERIRALKSDGGG